MWAIPCAFVSLVLATATGGHPPGVVFLPIALLVWAGGHAVLWGAALFARHGAALRGPAGWPPPSIVVLVVATGLASVAGVYLSVAGLLTGRGPSGPVRTALLVVVSLGHLSALVGLLLRARWGRLLGAACSSGWLIALSGQIVDHLAHGRPVDVVEGVVATAIGFSLATISARLLFGSEEKDYTAPRVAREPGDVP